METMGFIFGMSGFSFGLLGFVFAINAAGKVDKLEKKLQERGLLDGTEK